MSTVRVLLSRHQCIIVDKDQTSVHQLHSPQPEAVLELLEGFAQRPICLFLEPPWAFTRFQQTRSLSKLETIHYVQNFATSHQLSNEHIGLAFVPVDGSAKGFLLSCLSPAGQELLTKLQQKYIWRPASLAFVKYLLEHEQNVLIFRGAGQVLGLSKTKKHLIKLWIAPFAEMQGLKWSQDLYPFAEHAKILEMTKEQAPLILNHNLPQRFKFRSLKWHTKLKRRDWLSVLLPLLIWIGVYVFSRSLQDQVQDHLQEIAKLEALMVRDQQELSQLQDFIKQQEQISHIAKIYHRLQRESSTTFQHLKNALQTIPNSVWLERLTYYKNQVRFHLRAVSAQGIPDSLESFNSAALFKSVRLVSQEPYENTQRFIIEGTLPDLEE